MRLLLCGNPNSGKSTLFNRLCGAHRQTGNFAGVTVDAAEGSFSFGGEQAAVVDLPGMYTLASVDTEERVAADALRAADGVLVHEMKIVNGDQNGNFNPNGTANRAEAAQMIYNVIEFMKNR